MAFEDLQRFIFNEDFFDVSNRAWNPTLPQALKLFDRELLNLDIVEISDETELLWFPTRNHLSYISN